MEITGLVAGLGNPGPQYAQTRHNCGFVFIDALLDYCRKNSTVEWLGGQKFCCELWRASLTEKNQTWLLAKPQTFMNDSGRSIQPLLAWYKLCPEQLVVAHDELDIPCGELRFKFAGGNAGHNGLASIQQCLGSGNFYRLRIGIGKPARKSEVYGWVLGRPDKEEQEALASTMPLAVDVFLTFAKSGLEAAAKLAKKAGKEKTE